MAITRIAGTVNSYHGTVNETSTVLAFGGGGTTTAGSLLIAVIGSYTAATSVSYTVADNKSQTWTQATLYHGSGNFAIGIFFFPNNVGGASHQVTVTPNNTSTMSIVIAEYSGAALSDVLDGATSGLDSSNNYTIGPINPASAGLRLAAITHGGNTQTVTDNTGATSLLHDTTGGGSGMPLIVDERIGAAGAYSGDWTLGETPAAQCGIAAFKESAAPTYYAVFPRWNSVRR